MDPDLYYGLVRFLSTGEIPKTIPVEIGEEVEKLAKKFQLNKSKDLTKIDKTRQPYGPRIVINRHQMQNLLRQTHDHPLSGHQGQETTFIKTSEVYYWPNMKADIIEYVKTCKTCQRRERRRGEAPLKPIRKVTLPFYQVGLDVMGPLPMTLTGKQYIVVAVDHFTKWVEARALEEADAQSIISFLHDDVICRHGVPKIMSTDRGSEFINELMEAVTRIYDIHHVKTTAYHPQGNGQVERTNRTLKDILAKITPPKGDWSHYLNSALFATRVAKQASTNFSPAELLHGYQFRQPFDRRDQEDQDLDPARYAREELSRLQEIRTQAGAFIKKAQDRQKRNHDNAITPLTPLEIGDPVWLYRNIVESSWSAKMEPKWDGPYFVQDKKDETYRLRNRNGTILPKTYHRNRLKLHHGRLTSRYTPTVQVEVRTGSQASPRRNGRDRIP